MSSTAASIRSRDKKRAAGIPIHAKYADDSRLDIHISATAAANLKQILSSTRESKRDLLERLLLQEIAPVQSVTPVQSPVTLAPVQSVVLQEPSVTIAPVQPIAQEPDPSEMARLIADLEVHGYNYKRIPFIVETIFKGDWLDSTKRIRAFTEYWESDKVKKCSTSIGIALAGLYNGIGNHPTCKDLKDKQKQLINQYLSVLK
jgi:hypothetical protein